MKNDFCRYLSRFMFLRIEALLASILIFHKFHYIRDRAVKDVAEDIHRMDADALVAFQARHKRRTETILGCQSIFCNAFFFHGFPEVVIDDHSIRSEATAFSPLNTN